MPAFDVATMTKKYYGEVATLFSHELGDDAWSKKMIADSLKNEKTFGVVVCADKVVVGAILFDINDFETCVLELVVAKEFQRQKIGYHLFRLVRKLSEDKKIELIYLEVKATNEKAIAFYQKQGLSKIYERKNYYKDGTNAIIMGLNL